MRRQNISSCNNLPVFRCLTTRYTTLNDVGYENVTYTDHGSKASTDTSELQTAGNGDGRGILQARSSTPAPRDHLR